ncbi:MAG: hypothetical protein AAF228_03040 [Pseudomonadota bacterium]
MANKFKTCHRHSRESGNLCKYQCAARARDPGSRAFHALGRDDVERSLMILPSNQLFGLCKKIKTIGIRNLQ